MNDQGKSIEHLQAAKIRVLEKAMIYARLKVFGIWIDADGNMNRYSLNDEEAQTNYALEELGRAAEFLIHETTLQVDATILPTKE